MNPKMNVTLELELETFAGHLNAHERVMLARKFFRWAKQLYVSAQILGRDSAPLSPPVLPKCSRRKASPNRLWG